MDQRPCDKCVVLNEDPENSTSTQECTNLRNTLRDGPILDSLDSRRICNSAFISTNMSEDSSARNTNKGLLPTERSSIQLDLLNNPVYSLKMFPDKSTNTRITGKRLIGSIGKLIT